MREIKKVIEAIQTTISQCLSIEEIRQTLITLSTDLPNKDNIKFGCYCDLEEGQSPDDCVMDTGKLHECIYAKKGMSKWNCKYWKAII